MKRHKWCRRQDLISETAYTLGFNFPRLDGFLYTIKRTYVVFLKVLTCYFFAGCGMQQATNQVFDVTDLLATFPARFSMQAALHFIDLRHVFRCRLVCRVTYDQQIDFMVKGPFGIELMRGVISKKGVTVIDRLRRVVHQWDYKRIKQQCHFPCNYPLIQSLLLGRRCSSIEYSASDALSPYLTYTYDDLTRKVVAVQLVDAKQRNSLNLIYRHKMAAGRACLAGMKINFVFNDKGKPYQGRVTLHALHFRALKQANIAKS